MAEMGETRIRVTGYTLLLLLLLFLFFFSYLMEVTLYRPESINYFIFVYFTSILINIHFILLFYFISLKASSILLKFIIKFRFKSYNKAKNREVSPPTAKIILNISIVLLLIIIFLMIIIYIFVLQAACHFLKISA
jgi:hypothetical protein